MLVDEIYNYIEDNYVDYFDVGEIWVNEIEIDIIILVFWMKIRMKVKNCIYKKLMVRNLLDCIYMFWKI